MRDERRRSSNVDPSIPPGISAIQITLALVMGALSDIWRRTCFSYHHYPIQAYLPALYLGDSIDSIINNMIQYTPLNTH